MTRLGHWLTNQKWSVLRNCLAILILMVGAVALLSVDLGANDLMAGDEGYYGVMGRNVISNVEQLVGPSLSPLGPPGDKPFLYPLVLGAAIRLGGVDEVPIRLATVALAVFAALLLCLIGQALNNRVAGMWAAFLWLTSPMLADVGRRVAAEPLVIVLGLAGVWFFLRSLIRQRWPYAFIAGVLFGLGFLAKLWLILIPAAAVVLGSWLADLVSPEPGRLAWRRWSGPAFALLCGFLLTGSAQLVLCWLIAPQDFDHWLRIYFGFSLLSRLAGSGYADYWHKPVWYYLAAVGRLAPLCIPMAGLGVVSVVRRCRTSTQARLAAGLLLIWLAALVPMSIPSIKSHYYLLPMLPAVFLLAGYGVSSLVTHLAHRSLSARGVLPGAILGILGSAVSLAVLAHGQGRSSLAVLTGGVVLVAWTAALLFSIVPWRRGLLAARLALVGCLLMAMGGGSLNKCAL